MSDMSSKDFAPEPAERLMATGTLAHCPDCGDERLFVVVEEGEHCCTSCDAAVFGLDLRHVAGEPSLRTARPATEQVSRPA